MDAEATRLIGLDEPDLETPVTMGHLQNGVPTDHAHRIQLRHRTHGIRPASRQLPKADDFPCLEPPLRLVGHGNSAGPAISFSKYHGLTLPPWPASRRRCDGHGHHRVRT